MGSPTCHLLANVSQAYHHTILHEGTSSDPRNDHSDRIAFLQSFHLNGAIVYGTSLKTTRFHPWVLRFREDHQLFACIHAFNAQNETQFFSRWEVGYSPAPPGSSDRVILAGWFHESISFVYQDRSHYNITFARAVDLLGLIFHRHAWVSQADITFPILTLQNGRKCTWRLVM